jgi:maltose O-acetyltransferase
MAYLLFGSWLIMLKSWILKHFLIMRGASIGHNVSFKRTPVFRINGSWSNVTIGNNVNIAGRIDIMNRENGKIIIGDNCVIDRDCRLLAANQAVLHVKPNSSIGVGTIINAGTHLTIDQDCLIGGYCYFQTSNHNTSKNEVVRKQGYGHADIKIGKDVWLGSHVTVLAGVTINEGAIVGAKAVVTKELEAYSINVGVPATKVAMRD